MWTFFIFVLFLDFCKLYFTNRNSFNDNTFCFAYFDRIQYSLYIENKYHYYTVLKIWKVYYNILLSRKFRLEILSAKITAIDCGTVCFAKNFINCIMWCTGKQISCYSNKTNLPVSVTITYRSEFKIIFKPNKYY